MIPTIDLKGGVYYKHQDSVTRRSVVEKIGDAAEKWGFFQVVNHGIPLDVLEKVIEGVGGFHEQDAELKKRFYSRDHNRKMVYYSNFDLYTAQAASWRDTMCAYMAPDPPTLEDLPPLCGLPKEDEGNPFGFKCFKKIHDYQYWVDIPPVPGALVVNVGDLLQLISNDKFTSVEHRVIANRAAEPRISVPCFFSTVMKANPRVYGPIKELTSEQNPPKYRDTTIAEFSSMYGSKELNTSALHHFKI
ncbi:PREDICTED: 1-aminocyclopropane-1-carboxylate oxidase homolog 8-like [Camelina sativa]|uniref:1-aminocyclopropane-1-carboxylate oxidase homolog 8-like n=1 Tax=Camelina sativa TaxID=90675 RepID=A0ABM0ZCE5_CAMSA|nr:PREDICTED: 1-aminocyclopropane-1-carboxylate oxidase homolog 8-like [Camelina sativa]